LFASYDVSEPPANWILVHGAGGSYHPPP